MTEIHEGAEAPADLGWVPDSCTLPTVDQPVRVQEFDELFAESVRAFDRVDRTTLRLILDAEATSRARDLAARESSCCSFFDFEVEARRGDAAVMRVSVPAGHAEVLDAWTTRAMRIAGLTND